MSLKKERSYVMVKPDGVQRSLVGEITSRFERAGLKIVATKMFVPDVERLTKHYGKPDDWCIEKGQRMLDAIVEKGGTPDKTALEYGRGIVEALLKFMSAGPVVAMVLEGNCAVDVVKKLVGGTEPKTSDVGTIRGDYTLDSYKLSNLDNRAVRNLIHCTGEVDEADFEINLWFKPEEIINYRHINEAMLYDFNLDGILE
jgi:nucleoside-diphosphate kinase